METIRIGHHDDTCDGHYGSYNLQVKIKRPSVTVPLSSMINCPQQEKLHCGCFHTDPNAHEAILEDDPGQEKDEGLVAAVEGRDVSGGEFLQSQEVQVVGERPQDGEGCCPLYKELESHPFLPKELAALPDGEITGSHVTWVFPLGTVLLFVSLRTEMLVAWFLGSSWTDFVPAKCKRAAGPLMKLLWSTGTRFDLCLLVLKWEYWWIAFPLSWAAIYLAKPKHNYLIIMSDF